MQFYVGNFICKHTADLQIKHNEVMEAGARVYIPVSVAETRISKRFDTIPSGTLYPNADEIQYLQRLVKYKARLHLAPILSPFMLFELIHG